MYPGELVKTATFLNGHTDDWRSWPKRPHTKCVVCRNGHTPIGSPAETATDVCRNGHTTIVSPAETATDVCRNGHTKSDDTTILLSNV